MKNNTQILLALMLGAAAMLLSGCQIDDNAVTGFAYTEVGGSYVVTDQFDNSIVFSSDQAAQLASMGEEQATAYLEARFKADNPTDYADPTTAPLIEAETVSGEIVVSDQAKGVIAATRAIPGFGELVSLGLNGVLAVGAIWLRKKGTRAERVNQSLVQGVDTFRDILDQTPQGELIDRKLIEVLKERQTELGTVRAVDKLLDRYYTPTKAPIDLK